MTRVEAEEIFITVVLSDESAAVEISATEVQVFRVLIGRILKEMERKNKSLWLKAREYGIEYHAPMAIIKKKNEDRYKLFKIDKNGVLSDFVQSTPKNDDAEGGE